MSIGRPCALGPCRGSTRTVHLGTHAAAKCHMCRMSARVSSDESDAWASLEDGSRTGEQDFGLRLPFMAAHTRDMTVISARTCLSATAASKGPSQQPWRHTACLPIFAEHLVLFAPCAFRLRLLAVGAIPELMSIQFKSLVIRENSATGPLSVRVRSTNRLRQDAILPARSFSSRVRVNISQQKRRKSSRTKSFGL